MHQRSCKNNLLDDKNKLLDEVLDFNNIIIRVIDDNTMKLAKHHPKSMKTL